MSKPKSLKESQHLPKQSEILERPPAAFPPSWGQRAEKTVNGEKPKRGGDRRERGRLGRPTVEIMCPWCGNYVPVSKRFRHDCVSLVRMGELGEGKFRTEDMIAFHLRKAAIEMQKLGIQGFSYSDYLHLLAMARWYNDEAVKPRLLKGYTRNAKTTE